MASAVSPASVAEDSSMTSAVTSSAKLSWLEIRMVICVYTVQLVHGQVTIIFVVSVFVCLFVCLFVQSFFSAMFDPISIKLGHMLYVWV